LKLADGIRRVGFRKWYERELMQSHAHLVLTFLCSVGIFAAFEAFERTAPLVDRLIDVAAVIICGAVGLWALRRYLYLLTHAEAVANQADCPHCSTYARFTMVHEDSATGAVKVQCRKCEHRWAIQE